MVNHLLETSHPISSSPLRLYGSVADPSSIFRTHFQVPYPASPLFVDSYENTGCMGILRILEQHFRCHPDPAGEGSAFSFSPLVTFFPKASSTVVAMISRTRSRRAGTSSFVKPLVSMVSCR